MNCEDRCLIKVSQGTAKFADRRPFIMACGEERPDHWISTDTGAFKSLKHTNKSIAKTLTQFTGSGPRIGHHQNFANRQILLKQQAQIKCCDGPGFARAGSRLHQIDTLERDRKRIERSDTHPRASCTLCAGVATTSDASDSNSLSSTVSSRSRNAKAKNGSADSPTAEACSDPAQVL